MRKARKQSRVMGWELSFQLSEPGCGLSIAMVEKSRGSVTDYWLWLCFCLWLVNLNLRDRRVVRHSCRCWRVSVGFPFQLLDSKRSLFRLYGVAEKKLPHIRGEVNNAFECSMSG